MKFLFPGIRITKAQWSICQDEAYSFAIFRVFKTNWFFKEIFEELKIAEIFQTPVSHL